MVVGLSSVALWQLKENGMEHVKVNAKHVVSLKRNELMSEKSCQ